MESLITPGMHAEALEMVCYMCTLIAVAVSFVLTMRF